MGLQLIRCELCGEMAIVDTSIPPREADPEDVPKFAEGDRARRQRRQELSDAGVDLSEVAARFGDECSSYAHDWEGISWSEMSFGREVKDYLGRWPTRTEIRAAVRAAAEVSERETTAALSETATQGRCSVTIGDITEYVHLGDWRNRRESAERWREMRLEKWREMVGEPHPVKYSADIETPTETDV